MSDKHSISPEDILPDGVDRLSVNGLSVRKGTAAAFIANIEILEDPKTTSDQKEASLAAIKKLAPDIAAIGFHKHVVFKNPEVQEILTHAAKPDCL